MKIGALTSAAARFVRENMPLLGVSRRVATPAVLANHPLGSIMRPQAVGRWLMPQLAAITPQYIEQVLRNAMAGNHQQQADLFDLMLDTWPELAACAQELAIGVAEKQITFEAWREADQQPSADAEERMRLVSAALRSMRPDAAAPDENDLNGTIIELAHGWIAGLVVCEIGWESSRNPGQWHRIAGGEFDGLPAPRCTAWVHPRAYAFDERGRLGLAQIQDTTRTGQRLGSGQIEPLTENKFLVGTHKAKAGTLTGSAMLRNLAWWWCAANFSADWLLNLAQIFGLPFRWSTYDRNAPTEVVAKVCNMMQNMGSAGWGAFPEGTNIQFLEAASRGGDRSPQGELLDRADRYARLLILGQTMSGSQDSSRGGGKAFGAVEAAVKESRISACAKYVEDVINRQFIPAILNVTYGDDSLAPTICLETEKEEDLQLKATIIKTLADAGAGEVIGLDWIGKTFGIPTPAAGTATLRPSSSATVPPAELKQSEDEPEDLSARIARIHAITDDALFAAELRALASELK